MTSGLNEMKSVLIIEDDDEYIEILQKHFRNALIPLRVYEEDNHAAEKNFTSPAKPPEESDIYLVVAKTLEEAREILKKRDVYLATVDINLRGVAGRGKSNEGMEILKEMQHRYPNMCAILVSSEDPALYMREALRELGAVDFVQKDQLTAKDRTKFFNLLKSTLIYAKAVRLFNKSKDWTQAERIWTSLIKADPNFERANDVKNLGDLLRIKKSDLTGLPGQEWIQEELKQLLQDADQSDWAIVTVEINNFKPFQDRDFSEGGSVLKEIGLILQEIKQKVSPDLPPLPDLLLELFQPSSGKDAQAEIFLGEVDNTGRFIFIASSQKVAKRIQELVAERLTEDAFKAHYRLTKDNKGNLKQEYGMGYFEFQGQQVGLLGSSTKIVTSSQIKNPVSDVREFLEQIF